MSDTLAGQITATRSGAGLFVLTAERAALEVTGGDARRWLDGMISNDVTALEPGPAGSGCYATLLTPKGRIVADLHVLVRENGFWLETAASAIEATRARLDRYIIADDVTLAALRGCTGRLGIEGPRARAVLESAAGPAAEGALAALEPECVAEIAVAGAACAIARYGWTGEVAYQLFVPADDEDLVAAALEAAGAERASTEALEVMRIEAGVPLLGRELKEDVFPDEARLDRAISRTKGCYTGQEIVARLYSRGAVNHMLVGLRFAGAPPAPATELLVGGRKTGEVTSACVSPSAGAVGLGFVRREHAEPGTELKAVGAETTVAELPFVEASRG